MSVKSRPDKATSASCGYCCEARNVNVPSCGTALGREVVLEVGIDATTGGADDSVRMGDEVRVDCAFAFTRVSLWVLWRTGDDARSAFSVTSSSLSACRDAESRPSSLSVAHCLILHPSPSLRPRSSLSRNPRRSSKAS